MPNDARVRESRVFGERRRRVLLLAALVASAGLVASAHASWSPANDPDNWANPSNGLSSTKFRGLFKEVDARLGALETTFCNVTTSAYQGDQVDGYDGAADKCAGTPNCGQGARMCSAAELAAFASSGGVMPDGQFWYTTGMYVNMTDGHLNDCNGWTSATELGPDWRKDGTTKPGGRPDYRPCSDTHKIACCN